MDNKYLSLLTEQYHDYFVIAHQIPLNIKPLDEPEPSLEQFELMIPEPFRMSGELATLDKSALKSLGKLGELGEELMHYLRIQAQKIDSMMRYVLRQQDDPKQRFQSNAYGGSALSFLSQEPFDLGQLLEAKLFLADNDGAVYCFVRVIECTAVDACYEIKTTFTRIREADRELIVRASLHQQSRQLKRKAEERAQLEQN